MDRKVTPEELARMYGGRVRSSEPDIQSIPRPNLPLIASERLLAQEELMRKDFSGLEARILSQNGVERIHDSFMIDPTKWESPFKVGDQVKYGDDVMKVMHIKKSGDKINTVAWEWELKKVERPVSTLRRIWRWLRAKKPTGDASFTVYRRIMFDGVCPDCGAKSHSAKQSKTKNWCIERKCKQCGTVYLLDARLEVAEKLDIVHPEHELYTQIMFDGYCPACEKSCGFLEGPRGGSHCLNVKCSGCEQIYWLDTMTETAKRL